MALPSLTAVAPRQTPLVPAQPGFAKRHPILKDGFRDVAARLRRWRVGGRWWAFALLTGPLVFTVAVLVVGAAFSTGLPAIISTQDKLPMILLAVTVGLVVAACEETGWT